MLLHATAAVASMTRALTEAALGSDTAIVCNLDNKRDLLGGTRQSVQVDSHLDPGSGEHGIVHV